MSTLTTLSKIPKSSSFTKFMPPDVRIPTIAAAKENVENLTHTPRQLLGGSFTWVKPTEYKDREFLVASERAVEDLGLQLSEIDTDYFKDVLSGQVIIEDESNGLYPWSQCYAGWQFGNFAGQLGDGRVISLFEALNPISSKRYEVQIKGAGLTPYSRFADGKAVLRSSIREFLISEHLNALGIPSTRAIALTSLPKTFARRERIESCAIVSRMAPSWIRIGTFDLYRWRGDRTGIRKLSDYCIEELFGGEDNLVPAIGTQTKYQRLYREIVIRNAKTTAMWQVYGFMNGVLNTDNVSILGLSIDFGPFAFMDIFDKNHTPNHDDGLLRYSYKNTPSTIWWNLTRLGENLAELLGADSKLLEDEFFKKEGIKDNLIDTIIKNAENEIKNAGEEYQKEFLKTYNYFFSKRLGFNINNNNENDNGNGNDSLEIIDELLRILQECEVDFNHFFRRLGKVKLFENDKPIPFNKIKELSKIFFPLKRGRYPILSLEEANELISKWILDHYIPVLQSQNRTNDLKRKEDMDKFNPNFLLRGHILDELIEKVQQDHDIDYLKKILKLSVNPFEESWDFIGNEETNILTGDVPENDRGRQCGCSS